MCNGHKDTTEEGEEKKNPSLLLGLFEFNFLLVLNQPE